MSQWRLAGMALLAVLVLIVVLQNTQAVQTRILFFTVEMPRAFLLFVTLLFGFVLGIIAAGRAASRAGQKDDTNL